jgi:hypothetical protein
MCRILWIPFGSLWASAHYARDCFEAGVQLHIVPSVILSPLWRAQQVLYLRIVCVYLWVRVITRVYVPHTPEIFPRSPPLAPSACWGEQQRRVRVDANNIWRRSCEKNMFCVQKFTKDKKDCEISRFRNVNLLFKSNTAILNI